jgi:hypothetical protein
MSDKLENPPAFPCDPSAYNYATNTTGMTLRDYFAAAALQGLLAKYGVDADAYGDFDNNRRDDAESCAIDAARNAYEYADSMLKARQS